MAKSCGHEPQMPAELHWSSQVDRRRRLPLLQGRHGVTAGRTADGGFLKGSDVPPPSWTQVEEKVRGGGSLQTEDVGGAGVVSASRRRVGCQRGLNLSGPGLSAERIEQQGHPAWTP